MTDVSQLQKVAQRANKMLHLLTEQVQQQRMSTTPMNFIKCMLRLPCQNCLG